MQASEGGVKPRLISVEKSGNGMRWRARAGLWVVVGATACGSAPPGSSGGGGGWTTPTSLDAVSDGTANIVEPFAGVDGDGDAIVVWGRQDLTTGAGTDFHAAYVAGAGWQATTPISTPLDTGVAAMGGSRAFVRVAASQFQLASIDLHDLGAGWTTLETLSAGTISNPTLAANAAGDVFLVWTPAEAGARLRAARFSPGAGWSGPATLAADPASTATASYGSLRLGVDDAGVATVVWDENRSDFDGLMLAHYTEASGWSSAQVLEAGATGGELAVAAAGGGVVAWTGSAGVTAARFAAGAPPGAPEPLGMQANNAPEVAVANNGRALAVWRGPRDMTNAAFGLLEVVGSGYAPGSGWRAPAVFPADPAAPAGVYRQTMALDGDGDGLVVSLSSSGGALSVFDYSASSGPSQPKVIETALEALGLASPPATGTVAFGTPHLAMNAAGAAVFYCTVSATGGGQSGIADKRLRATMFAR
jgi:hypothetical protein